MRIEKTIILDGYNRMDGHILFDNDELSIQRNVKHSGFDLVLSVMFLILTLSVVFNYGKNGDQGVFYISIFSAIASMFLLVITLPKYIKVRNTNNRLFQLSYIVKIQIHEERNSVKIAFEFKDKTKDKITIIKGDNYLEFIDTLKRNNIEIIRVNNC